MDIEMRECTAEEVKHLASAMQKERVALSKSANFIGAFIGGYLVGVVGHFKMPSSIRYCTDYVIPTMRGKGVYRKLWERRDSLYPEATKTAYCTPMSLPTYLKHGFVVTQLKNGISTVVKH